MPSPSPHDADEKRGDSPTPTSSDPERAVSPGPGLAAHLAEGAKGGFVATLVMTAYRLPVSRSLPPTAEFWARFVSGGDPGDHPIPAVVLHLLYGTFAGMVFGLLAPVRGRRYSTDDERDASADRRDADRRNVDHPDADRRETARLEAVGLLTGALYGLALSLFGERAVLGGLLGLDLAADERLVFHAGHLVYGLSLGTWFGSRTGDRR